VFSDDLYHLPLVFVLGSHFIAPKEVPTFHRAWRSTEFTWRSVMSIVSLISPCLKKHWIHLKKCYYIIVRIISMCLKKHWIHSRKRHLRLYSPNLLVRVVDDVCCLPDYTQNLRFLFMWSLSLCVFYMLTRLILSRFESLTTAHLCQADSYVSRTRIISNANSRSNCAVPTETSLG